MRVFLHRWILLLAVGLALPAAAQDKVAERRLGDDVFVAGSDVRIAESGLEDIFAAGRDIAVTGNVRESVHLFGRRLRITGAVGQDAYAAGQEVEIRGPVTGDITAAGERVELTGSAGADIALAGQKVAVTGPVGGDASLVGQEVEITAPITGSVQVRAERIRFGPGARIDGTLAYWSPNRVDIPAGVIAANRVAGVRTEVEHKTSEPKVVPRAVRFVVGVAVFLVLAAILAAIAPGRLALAHERVVERPWLNLLLGVIAASALFGSVLVLVLSIIGLPLVPVVLVLAPLVCALGYLTTAFTVGRLSLGLAHVRRMEGWLGAFTAMATGVVLLAVLRLVPIVGWLVLVFAVIVGLGGWFALLLRPRATAA